MQNVFLRRYSALIVLLCVVVLPIACLFLWSAETCVDYVFQIYTTSERVESYRARVAEMPEQARAIEAMQIEISRVQGFYEQNTSEAASASMAQALKETLGQSGGELRSVTINPASRSDDLERLEVGLDAVIPSAALPKFLASLQAIRPFLYVTSMAISPAQFGMSEGQLWVTMKVSALRRVRRDAL